MQHKLWEELLGKEEGETGTGFVELAAQGVEIGSPLWQQLSTEDWGGRVREACVQGEEKISHYRRVNKAEHFGYNWPDPKF